jgi:hypothetical protein
VRRAVDVPIAADESIRRAADPYRVRDLEAADVAVLKVQPLGGVRACLRIAEDIGLPVVVSSALETSVGIAAGVRAGRPRCPSCRTPAGWPPSSCSPTTSCRPAAAGGRRAAGRRRRSTTPRCDGSPPRPGRALGRPAWPRCTLGARPCRQDVRS